jgi:hypothetical protein
VNVQVQLELSREEAPVLFDWMSRFDERKDVVFEDSAEQRVLWDIECMLESALVEPLQPDYNELVARARATVRDADS